MRNVKQKIALCLATFMTLGFVGCNLNFQIQGGLSLGSEESVSQDLTSGEISSVENSEEESSWSESSQEEESSSEESTDTEENSSEAYSSEEDSDTSEENSSQEESSSADEEEKEESTLTYDGSQVTVTFYHTMGAAQRDILDSRIEEFNKYYPNIVIDHMQIGGYNDLRDYISNELIGNNSPSIAYCYPEHVALYNEHNAVVALEDYINSTEIVMRTDGKMEMVGFTQAQKDDFIAGFYNDGKYVFGGESMYMLPFLKSTDLMYYNKTYFDKNGLTVPATWDEVEVTCQKIKEIEGAQGRNIIPLGYDSAANWFVVMTEQLGSKYLSFQEDNHFVFNNSTNRAFVEKFRGWYEKGYVTTADIYGDYTTGALMCIGSSAGASYHILDGDEEIGVAPIPQVDVNNPKTIIQGPSLCLLKQENAQETAAAWLFMKFLTTDLPLQAMMSMRSGFMPVIKSVEHNEIYKTFLSKADGKQYLQATAIKQAVSLTSAYFDTPCFSGSSQARSGITELMYNCLVNPLNGQTAAEFIASEFDRVTQNLKDRYDK